jgi:hypothetical protein
MDYRGMEIDILELFVEAQHRARQPRLMRGMIDSRELTRFATLRRAARRSLDDRQNRRVRSILWANVEARAESSDAAFRAAYASTFTAAQARLRGSRRVIPKGAAAGAAAAEASLGLE